jgi:hypothetical protein
MGKILIGCEESQTITKTFREAGLEAYSCDLLPTRGNPEWHLEQDVVDVIPLIQWDLIILHPECTAMALSGNRWYSKGMPHHYKRLEAVAWTLRVWEMAKLHSQRAALENPVGVLFQNIPERVQYIQPWEFGEDASKKTGFALHNLPSLLPTDVLTRERYANQTASGQNKLGPSLTRKRDRSKTYQGIASAIVNQWGGLLQTGGKTDA